MFTDQESSRLTNSNSNSIYKLRKHWAQLSERHHVPLLSTSHMPEGPGLGRRSQCRGASTADPALDPSSTPQRGTRAALPGFLVNEMEMMAPPTHAAGKPLRGNGAGAVELRPRREPGQGAATAWCGALCGTPACASKAPRKRAPVTLIGLPDSSAADVTDLASNDTTQAESSVCSSHSCR